jgi:hypothetical protein
MSGGYLGRLPFLGAGADDGDGGDDDPAAGPAGADDGPTDEPSARVVARDDDWAEGQATRVRPLAAIDTDSFRGFGVLTADASPDYDVPGTHRSRLHDAACERYDVDAVPPGAAVAAVSLDDSGAVVGFAWFAEHVDPDTFRRDHQEG